MSNPTYQEKIARFKLSQYYNAFGPRGAAAEWYSGQSNPNATFGPPGGPRVYQYVNSIMALMGRAPNNLPSSSTNTGGVTNAQTTAASGGGGGGVGAGGILDIPMELIGGTLGTALGAGIEIGITDTIKALWDAFINPFKWSIEMLFGIFGFITVAMIIFVVYVFDKAVDNRDVIGAIAAAPATNGMSLLLGASLARRHAGSQATAEDRSARLQLAQEREEGRRLLGGQRISIAERRLLIQEAQEQRRAAAATAPVFPEESVPPPPRFPSGQSRVQQIIRERQRLVAQGLSADEIRKRIQSL